MKSKRQRGRHLQPEECGVWLDTAELKKRSHQTVIPCTSSNRFNPLLRRQNVDSATFEFTQTKTPQLCTKQTSMFSFFSPKGKNLMPSNKENISGSLFVISNTEENDDEPINVGSSAECVDEPSASENTYSCSPPSDIQQSVKSWNENFDEGCSVNDILVHPTDIVKRLSVRTENKRSCPTDIPSTDIAKQHSVSSLNATTSYCPNKDLYTESQQDSPLFTQDSQGNTVIAHRSTRDKQKTCYPSGPLQDRTNVCWDTASPVKRTQQYLCDEDSLRHMFTQDSEGNMVIKH